MWPVGYSGPPGSGVSSSNLRDLGDVDSGADGTTANRALRTTGSGWEQGEFERFAISSVEQTGQTSATLTVTGGRLAADGDRVRFRFVGRFTGSGQFTLRYGGSTVLAVTGMTTSAEWVLTGEIVRTGASAQRVSAHLVTSADEIEGDVVSLSEANASNQDLDFASINNTEFDDASAEFVRV